MQQMHDHLLLRWFLGECLELCLSDPAHAVSDTQSGVALAEEYGALISGCKFEAADRQIDQLRGRDVGRERGSGLGRFSDHAIQAFDPIGRMDKIRLAGLPDRRRRMGSPPGTPLGRGDGWIFPGPFFLEGISLGSGHFGRRGPVNPAQVGCYLPRAEVQAVAHQMQAGSPNHGLGKGGGDRLGEALKPVHNRDPDVLE